MTTSRIDYQVADWEPTIVSATKKGKRIIISFNTLHIYFTCYKFDELCREVNRILPELDPYENVDMTPDPDGKTTGDVNDR